MEKEEKTRLFLVGYMGAGKTTLGKLLAKKLNLHFIDVDLFIENRYHKSTTAIFEEKGEAGFREIERQILQEIIGFENVIIATGGGLPCFFDNMDLMNQTGITIYLRTGVEELTNRLKSAKQKRPLIKGKTLEELKDFINISLKKREIFYNKATVIFDTDNFFAKKNNHAEVEDLVRIIYLKK
jgi:shikimate kinase